MRGMSLNTKLVVALAMAAVSAVAWAQGAATPTDNYLKNREEGWFWYQVESEPPPPPKPIMEEKKPAPMPSVIKIEKPKLEPMSVEWFQKEYPKILDAAIDDPSTENVKKYRYATRVMLDKASNFTRTFQRESLLDPLLDESVRSPFSSAFRGSSQRLSSEQKQKATATISKKAGLWVFLDDKCPFCALQYPIVARTAKERGFIVSYITPDGKRPTWLMGDGEVLKDAGQSRYLRIGVRPAIALVIPPENVTVLAQGMLSQDLLEERILHAGDAAGLITGQARKDAFPEHRGILTPEDIKEIGREMDKNPKGLTPSVQQRIEKRF